MCGATYEVTNHQADILNARLKKWLAGEDLGRRSSTTATF